MNVNKLVSPICMRTARNKNFAMKIRAYLLMMVLAIFIPIIIFSGIALQMLLSSERRAALRSLHETARATALIVDRELSSAEAALQVLASSPHLASGDMARFHAQAKIADRGEGGRTVLFTPNGQQIINTLVPFGTPPPSPPSYVQKRTQQVIQTQKTLVSGAFIGAIKPRPVTIINIPVSLESGPQYVLGTVFNTEYFQKLILQRQMPPGWTVAVVDREGLLIAHSGKSAAEIGQHGNPSLVNAARLKLEGQIRHDTSEGIDSYDAFTHSSLSGWTVAAAAPVREIEATARRAATVAALGLLAAMIVAGGAAFLFGRRLVRSISRAAMAAEVLGRGEAPEPDRAGVVEVDELHRALRNAGMILVESETERIKLLEKEQQARKTAEQQNKLKDEFLAMLGHELRNPLSAIVGAVEIMHAKEAGAEAISHAKAILRRQTEHLTHIVDELLDLARLSTGKIMLHKRPIDLAGVAQSSVGALRAAGKFDHVLTLQAEPVWINADRTRLEQIINNLLINAIKYTPAGGRIDIRVFPEKNDAVLVVQDTGIGIPAELMPQLFDIFVQGSVSLDRSQGGLGIGLSLVRTLVMLHDGTVTADSPGPDQGSTFTVRFPREVPGELASNAFRAESAHVESRCTVLLVEDNDDARRVVSDRLLMKGYAVLEAANGTDGLQLAATKTPNIAIVDIGLPGMDGYELARSLRADPATRGIWLIALTGYGQEADRKRAVDAGFDTHFVKPVAWERLMEAIQIYCARSK